MEYDDGVGIRPEDVTMRDLQKATSGRDIAIVLRSGARPELDIDKHDGFRVRFSGSSDYCVECLARWTARETPR